MSMSFARMLPSTGAIEIQPEVGATVFQSTKTLTQVAAFPYVVTQSGIEVLLVTSRRRGRWILPRGWPVEGMSHGMAAAKEAKEEAGVIGEMSHEALGDYLYKKRTGKGYRVPCRVFVYPLLVTQQRLDWRERGEREQRWCDLSDAADLVRHDGLADLLRDLAQDPDLASRLVTNTMPIDGNS